MSLLMDTLGYYIDRTYYYLDNPSENGKGGEITTSTRSFRNWKDPTITVADASSDTYIRVKLTGKWWKLDEEIYCCSGAKPDINDTEWR